MTPEQKQQLDQVIKRHNQQPPSTSTITCWNDVDFLLSLVKSQEAEPEEIAAELDRRAPVYHQEDIENAATLMRSACIERVRALAESWAKSVNEQWEDRPDLSFDAAERLKAAGEIIAALESVFIQEQEK